MRKRSETKAQPMSFRRRSASATTEQLVHVVKEDMNAEQAADYVAGKLRQQSLPFPEPPPVDTRVSPNTGKALSAAEAERVVRGRSARIVGRILITNCETFACKPCLDRFIDVPVRDPSKPWPQGPMNYRVVWEPRAGEGKSLKCVWCDKQVRGEE